MKIHYKLYALFFVFFLAAGTLFAQLGTTNYMNASERVSVENNFMENGNNTLGPVYNFEKCGLNYTQATRRLGRRFSPLGVLQPATFSISGIPAGSTIEQAYLWADASGNGAAMTAAIKNPANVTGNYPLALVGSAPDKCWGYSGSHTYRANVTSAITGNGNYLISGLLTGSPNDVDGATLFIIYSDPSATFKGSMIIYDGAIERSGGTLSLNISGFSACGTSTSAKAFSMIGDLQISTPQVFMNGNFAPFTPDWWNFIEVNTTVVSGQASSNFSVNAANDCINFCVAGLYYQTTNCTTCGCISPVISCPGTITATTSGACSAIVAFAATATGNPAPVVTYSQNPGTAFPVGTTVVSATATNSCGTTSCSFNVIVNDVDPPTAICKPVTITLQNGTASITASDINDGSNDNCGTITLNVSKENFTCEDIGANTVILTVTDPAGLVSTCEAIVTVVGELPDCSIASEPANNIYTGGVSTNLYLGYGSQSTTLQVTTPASGAPYTYSWTGTGLSNSNSANPVFTPATAGVYNFTVLVTNKYGCSATCSITICVLDIRELDTNGDFTGKVYLCHIPPGNPENPQTLSISVNAVPNHLGNHAGDRLGKCSDQVCQEAPIVNRIAGLQKEPETMTKGFLVNVLPNPTHHSFTIYVNSDISEQIILRLFSIEGKLIQTLKPGVGDAVIIGENLISGIYLAEISQGNYRNIIKLVKQ